MASKITLFCLLAAGCLILAACLRPDYPSLWESKDPTLQKSLYAALEEAFRDDFWRTVDRGKIGIAVVDITDARRPRVAEINGDIMLYAASLPKIAILLGAFVEIERGRLKLNEELRASLTRMIRHSSNEDATRNLHRVGFDNLADILCSDRFKLYDPAHNGGLWIGQDYAGDREWRRDPLHHIAHGATAMQTVRFYYLAYTGRLVASAHQDDFWEILSRSAIDSKFVKGLEEVNPDAEIYRKSGTWRHFHADSGVVVDEDYRYIIAALIAGPGGEAALVKLIEAVERVMKKRHGEGR
jgi:beta-lactamase class A